MAIDEFRLMLQELKNLREGYSSASITWDKCAEYIDLAKEFRKIIEAFAVQSWHEMSPRWCPNLIWLAFGGSVYRCLGDSDYSNLVSDFENYIPETSKISIAFLQSLDQINHKQKVMSEDELYIKWDALIHQGKDFQAELLDILKYFEITRIPLFFPDTIGSMVGVRMIRGCKLRTNQDCLGRSPLHILLDWNSGCSIGDFRVFIESSNLDERDILGRTPLYTACFRGNSMAVKELLSQGADDKLVDKEHGFSPLHVAAAKGHMDICKLLVSSDQCLVMWKDNEGKTPVVLAAKNRHPTVFKFLNLVARPRIKNISGLSPFGYYVSQNDLDTVKWMIDTEDVADINQADKHGYTPLMDAIENENLRLVEILINIRGIQINPQGPYGQTALHFAVKRTSVEIVKLLLAHPNIDPNPRDYEGRTPLIESVRYGRLDIFRVLILSPAVDRFLQDYQERDVLWHALQGANQQIIQTLLWK